LPKKGKPFGLLTIPQIYFVLLALALLFESWTVFIIGWFPFYSWIRLGVLLWLVLPQTQGAKLLYVSYVSPFIIEHERQIDEFIGELHNKLESIGLGYLGQLADFIRGKAFGQAAPQRPGAPQDKSAAGYAQSLMSRFAMPDARTNAQNLYGMLSGLSVPTTNPGRPRDFSPSQSSQSTFTMPSGSNLEKANYIASERARLAAMLRNLENEQQTIDLAYGADPTSKSSLPTSHSEASFESISHSDVLPIPASLVPGQKSAPTSRRTASGNWVSSWFADAPVPSEESSRPTTGRSVSGQSAGGKAWNAAKEVTDAIQGMSSSVDTGDREMPDHRRY
jgi:hypothetical protein